MARASYPDTPAGRTRQMRDADDEYLTRRGHNITWKRGPGPGRNWLKGVPSWVGRCRNCGDVIIVADATGNTAVRIYEDENGSRRSMRKCVRGRRRLWPRPSSTARAATGGAVTSAGGAGAPLRPRS